MGGQMSPFTIYIGKPEKGHHPLHFQADWVTKVRSGAIPPEVMDSITQLQQLAEKNNVSLEDLCVYALGTEEEQRLLEEESSEEGDTELDDSEEEIEEEEAVSDGE
ncbi:MAG: DUF2610 domain-containing protein, partial [Rickettsiales bacterium]